MQASRELRDLERSGREPGGSSSFLTYFWRPSAEAAVEVACGRGAAGPEGSTPDGGPACPGAGEKCVGWHGLGWVEVGLYQMYACACAAGKLEGCKDPC